MLPSWTGIDLKAMNKLVAIVGSFRPEEKGKYHLKETAELFSQFTEELGYELATCGHSFICAWSNDNLESQFLNGKYRFGDTAEFHALKGYLAAVASDDAGSAGRNVRLYVSEEMWNGGQNSVGRKFESVGNILISSNLTLRDCEERNILQIVTIDGSKTGNLLRSEMLEQVVQVSDVIIAMGGGKATQLVRHVEPHSWIPLDFFGGSAASRRANWSRY